jgi:serine/threonine-protein kinase
VPSCPRCLRPLPPTATALCVYCGASLTPSQPKTRPLPAKSAEPLVGKTIAGRFHVEDFIGQGGMGKVFKARHLALDRSVVLKMLKPALLEDPTIVGRFEREAKAASRLNHPNVIQVLDFGREQKDGSLYIVMEFVQGKDLRVILRDEWPLAEDRLCNIMAQVCGALSEAHAHNIIHRDLKPENVMVEERRDQPDFVKVLDFGIAKLLDAEGPHLTSIDVVCGTPQYMAPEQATGTHLDARCDLYAVGVILYQMTTGHLPFDGANSMEVLTKQVHDRPIPPRQRTPDAPISEAMEALILRALEKDAGRRPQTAEQFRDELLAVPAKAREKRASLQAAEPLLRVPTPAQSPKAAESATEPTPRKNRRWWPFHS